MFVDSKMTLFRTDICMAITKQATGGLCLKVRDNFRSELGELLVFKFSILREVNDK